MSSYYKNMHIKCGENNIDALALICQSNLKGAYVSKVENGWVSIFPEDTADIEEDKLAEVCAAISETTSSPTIAFLGYDDIVFMYYLALDGKIVDSYNSTPGYNDGDYDQEPEGGDVNVLMPLVLPGSSREDLTKLLTERISAPINKSDVEDDEEDDYDEDSEDGDYIGTDLAYKLAEYLELPQWRACADYNHISNDDVSEYGLTELADPAAIVEITPDEKGWAKCPKCERKFSLKSSSFEENKHSSCGQRLMVVGEKVM